MGDAKRRATAIKTGTVEGCGNCRFYLDDPMTKGGVCRRLPPVPVMLGLKNGPNGVYPEVGNVLARGYARPVVWGIRGDGCCIPGGDGFLWVGYD